MTGYIVIIVLFLVLFFSYTNSKNLNLFCKTFLLAALSLKFILFKLNFSYASLAIVFLFVLILLLFLVNIKKILNTKYSKTIILSQFLFLAYILITGILRGDVVYILDLTKFYFFGSFLFLIIISNRKKVNFYSINKFIFYFTFILSILGLLQFLYPSLSDFFVIDLTKFGYGEKTKIDVFKRVVGISPSTTGFGNLMAFLLTYLIAVRNYIFTKSNYIFYVFVLFSFSAIVLTGVRTSLASLFIALLILSVIGKDKQLFKFLSLLTVAILFSWQSLLLIGENYNQKTEGFSNPIGRSLQLFSLISDQESEKTSTFTLSVESFDEFLKNPIFGTGDDMEWLQYYSITDAYLIYHLIQIGFVGIIILFFPYLKIINRKVIKVLFLILILQTITDTGIFTNDTNLIFWIIAAIIIKKEKYFVDRQKNVLKDTFLINQNINK